MAKATCNQVRRIILACLVIVFFLGSMPLVSAEGLSFQGSLSNRYKFRSIGSLKDHDIETLLSLDIGNARQDTFSAAIQGGGIFDLDGDDFGSPLSSVYDTFSGSAVGRLYYAYLDANRVGPLERLRIGRQHRYQFESLYYDGMTLETKSLGGVSAVAFGGVPVHLYENQLGFDKGDWMVGGALQWDILSNLGVRADYVHLKDKVTGFRVGVGDQEDDLFGGTLWWDIDRYVNVVSRFTAFSDQVRDVRFTTNVLIPDEQLRFRFDFFRLLEGYAVRVIDFDAFGVAGNYVPYSELSFSAGKGWSHVALDGGFVLRFLDDRQAASAFNHGFERVYLSFTLFDLPEGLSLNATGDYYHGEDSVFKNNFFGGSFSATQDLLEDRLRLSAGTAYYLYRFNVFSGDESEDIQTYFAQVRGKILENLELRVGYEFEDNDFENFHSADVRVIWSFQ